MYTEMTNPSLDPLQSSNNFMIPVKFERETTASKPKQQQLVVDAPTAKKTIKKTKQCRICLESDQQQSKLVKPCKCTGSIEYAHVHCLIEWIKRRIGMNSDLKAKCEVCDTEFNYKLATERVFDCSQLTHHYRKQKRGLICFGVIYFTLLLCFITMIILTIIGKDDESLFVHNMLSSSGGATLIVSCIVIFFIGLIVVTVLFISEYMVKQQVSIIDVEKYKESKGLVKNYKIYFRR